MQDKSSVVAEMGDRLDTIDMGRKVGGAALPPSVKELGLHLTQCGPAEAYLHIEWHPNLSNRLVTIDVDRKLGGCAAVPLFGRADSPSNTMSPGLRPTSVPSGILIHSTVWPRYTNFTDRTDRTNNGPMT